MYGAPYIFYFVHPIVKTVKIMVQRVDFERNLKNICPATVLTTRSYFDKQLFKSSTSQSLGKLKQQG